MKNIHYQKIIRNLNLLKFFIFSPALMSIGKTLEQEFVAFSNHITLFVKMWRFIKSNNGEPAGKSTYHRKNQPGSYSIDMILTYFPALFYMQPLFIVYYYYYVSAQDFNRNVI